MALKNTMKKIQNDKKHTHVEVTYLVDTWNYVMGFNSTEKSESHQEAQSA